jgi:hypothetical protein
VRPRPEDEIDEKSYIYFQDLMDSLEDLPPTYSSKDLGKLASIENLPPTFSSQNLVSWPPWKTCLLPSAPRT